MRAKDSSERSVFPGTESAEKQPMLLSPRITTSKTVFSPETEVYLARCFGPRTATGESAKVTQEDLLSVLWRDES